MFNTTTDLRNNSTKPSRRVVTPSTAPPGKRIHRRHVTNKCRKNTKKQVIIDLLEQGKTPRMIARDCDYSLKYVEFVRDVYFHISEEEPDDHKHPCRSLQPELTGEYLKRYLLLKEYRQWCEQSKIAWTEEGMRRFVRLHNFYKSRKNKRKAS
ncbi:MAG: hypothetical protein Q4G59_05335 [Planctomycetia bacterium]|nr:hypothetical protein [Planctomycetia bacterium]